MRLIGEIFRNAFRRPFTQRYPKIKPDIPDKFRGKVEHDPKKCIYCGMCARECPSGAITVNPKAKTWSIDYGRCIHCGTCEEVCRDIIKKNAIQLTKVFEMADIKKKNLNYSDRHED